MAVVVVVIMQVGVLAGREWRTTSAPAGGVTGSAPTPPPPALSTSLPVQESPALMMRTVRAGTCECVYVYTFFFKCLYIH